MYSERIKQLRKQEKMSQTELGNYLDVSASAIYKWETGKSQPDINSIVKMCELFHVTADYLVGLTNKPGEETLIPTPTVVAAHETEGMPPVTTEEMQEVIKKAYLLLMQEEMKKKE